MTHCFDVDHAREFGLEEAVAIHAFQFWIGKNRDEERNFREGRWWTYNSLSALAEMFPYWSVWQTRTVIRSLVKQGVLIQDQAKKATLDRRGWYAFSDEERFLNAQAEERRGDSASSMLHSCLVEGADMPVRRVISASSCKEQLGTPVRDGEPPACAHEDPAPPTLRTVTTQGRFAEDQPPVRVSEILSVEAGPPPPDLESAAPAVNAYGMTEAGEAALADYLGCAPTRKDRCDFLALLEACPGATDEDFAPGVKDAQKFLRGRPPRTLEALGVGIRKAVAVRIADDDEPTFYHRLKDPGLEEAANRDAALAAEMRAMEEWQRLYFRGQHRGHPMPGGTC